MIFTAKLFFAKFLLHFVSKALFKNPGGKGALKMGGRGRERLVRCEKCGRLTRRDKAVFIEKLMFSNPLDRNQVQDEQYRTAIFREVCYCPSCGKHGRIYEKKKQQNERNREREKAQEARGQRPNHPYGPRPAFGPRSHSQHSQGQPSHSQTQHSQARQTPSSQQHSQTQYSQQAQHSQQIPQQLQPSQQWQEHPRTQPAQYQVQQHSVDEKPAPTTQKKQVDVQEASGENSGDGAAQA